MSSSSQSDLFDPRILGVIALGFGGWYLTYQKEVDEFVKALPLIVLGVSVIGVAGWFVCKKLNEDPIPTYSTPHQETPNKLENEVYFDRVIPFKPPEPITVQNVPARQDVPKRTVIIDTERLLSRAAHWYDSLTPEEQEYLKSHGYELKKFVPFDNNQPEPCLIKKNGLESYEHIFVVNMLAHQLVEYTDKIQIHLTQLPDIIFDYNGQEYAVEVETPFGITKKHRRLAEKAKTNNVRYGERWVFVVTKSAYAKSFKRYGKVIRRSEIQDWLWGLYPPPPE